MPTGIYKRDYKKIYTKERNLKIAESMKGSNNHRYKGGRIDDKYGYILILSPEHPNRNKHGYVREHRLVMESYLGRVLLKTEVVHHINNIRNDNRIENLMVFSDQAKHTKHHEDLRHV